MFPIQDNVPSRNVPIVTGGLILLNAVVFAFELTLSPEALEQFFYLFGIVPARYTHPEWAAMAGLPPSYWAFFTHMFLHGGWAHIIANMWTLWIFGDNVEDRMGPVRFLVFYLLCGLAAGIAHLAINPASTIPSVGASGAIAGVLGAYLLLYPRAQVVALVPIFFLPYFIALPAFFYLGAWFVSQLFSGTFALTASQEEVGGIAWWAHIGGFVAGMATYWLFLRPHRERRMLDMDEYGMDGAWTHDFDRRTR